MNEFAVGDRVRITRDHLIYRVPKGSRGRVTEVVPGLLQDGFRVALEGGREEMFGARHLELVQGEPPIPVEKAVSGIPAHAPDEVFGDQPRPDEDPMGWLGFTDADTDDRRAR